MRHLLADVIRGIEGFEVSGTAANTWEARIEVDRRRPDLVLLDEVLPGESGIDFLQLLVQDGVPVLLITGMERASHPLPPGALGRIKKPGWKTLDRDREGIGKAIRAVLSKPKP